jgi:hypothetical protein
VIPAAFLLIRRRGLRRQAEVLRASL